MKRRQTSRGRSGGHGSSTIEWVGGIATLPGYVANEGEPYRPEAIFWMTAEGAVLGSMVAGPGELPATAGASLQSTIEQPIYGQAHAPTRLRVASAQLADILRASHPDIEVVCAPTPELDEMLDLMREHLTEQDVTEQSYLLLGVDPDAMAAFFKAAAALFRAQPWKVVPDDESLFSVTIEQLGVRDAALSVIGQMGESFGIVLFPDIYAYEAFLEAGEMMALDEEPEVPPHFALNFERGAELEPDLRREIAEHNWEVAAADAYPSLLAIDGDLVARPPTARELTMAEALARALTEVLAEKQSLRAAWEGGEPVSRTLAIATHEGALEVTLRAPFALALPEFDDSYDILAALAELSLEGGEINPYARVPLEDELLRRFAAAPEAQGLEDIFAFRFVMNLAADYFSATIATLDPNELDELLFELVPRKVSIDASEAQLIVEECRALYAFLKRECGLKQADACLRVLGGNAADALEAALADRSKFGMAKSLFMTGREAGFDIDSPEGIEEWLQFDQDMPLPSYENLPPAGAPRAAPKSSKNDRKKKRKAARKARKKNR
ncbi:MAG: hypothetical protein RQ826_00145 [Xanthomonadales bacterium]|nr:hypothetical protein [Xanthomonadales bacterium]